jgi:glycosyltransferase involved in cell wall biosynthesis
MLRASVVIATHDRSARLDALLESLRAQTIDDFEVVVVDDASTDATPQVLAAHAARDGLELRVVRREANGGQAAARNDGWRAARAPVVAFTDDDCVAAPGWLAAGLAACEAAPAGAVVQGRTDPIPDELGRYGPYSTTHWIHAAGPWFETCNIFYPRALLERLDGFDAAAYGRWGGEDTDLAWRAIEAGAPVAYAPEARVHHAVHVLGPVGRLRAAARAGQTMRVFARHPELRRRHAIRGLFWKWSHYRLALLIAALVLPRRLWPVHLWLAAPYLAHEAQRSGKALAPYVLVHDLVEMGAAARGSLKHGRLVL